MQDLGSTNGTFLERNGELTKMDETKCQELITGDCIQLGFNFTDGKTKKMVNCIRAEIEIFDPGKENIPPKDGKL